MADKKWLAISILIAVAVVVAMGAYYNQQLAQKDQQIQALQQALSQQAPTAVSPANIEFLQTGGSTFDFSAEVDANGSVSAAATKTLTFDIVNKDDTKSATIRILTVNPLTGASGIPDGLNNTYFNVFIKADGKTKYLYTEGKHTDGWVVSLGVAEAFSGTLGITLEQAPDGTFKDGQTYTITLFLYQEASNYLEKVEYTVTT